MSTYPFRYAIGEGVRVHQDAKHFAGVAGRVSALELSARGTCAVVTPSDDKRGPFRVMETQLTRL